MQTDDESLIAGCVNGKRSAQHDLYRKYSPVMMAVCMRYARSRDEAEDMLQEAFLKIFQNIRSYRGDGSFEGWMKRIMINHSLNYYRKHKRLPFFEDLEHIDEREIMQQNEPSVQDTPVSADTILALIRTLPPGYRLVFNMFVIDEYNHKEIADALKISENTSKTQLLKARRMLQKKLSGLNMVNNTI